MNIKRTKRQPAKAKPWFSNTRVGSRAILMLCLSTLIMATPAHVFARDFFVNPTTGSETGDGSAARPWRTLQQVIEANLIQSRRPSTLPPAADTPLEDVNAGAPIQAGDRILLASGEHGVVSINGMHNRSPITIAAMPGAAPHITHVHFRGASAWILTGLRISPAEGETPVEVVNIENHAFWGFSADITIENCDVLGFDRLPARFLPRTPGNRSARASWWSGAPNGIVSTSDDITVRNNNVTNTRFSIQMQGIRALVSGNTIRNFSGDAMRGLGDYGVFEYNYVANSYDVDDNHDDGFQSWSRGPGPGPTGRSDVTGMVIRGNFILNRETDYDLAGPLQGIVCFDGFAVDWEIENNVVIVDHFHGISLAGARNARIVNNTVMDYDTSTGRGTWIQVRAHRDRGESTGNVLRNNLSTTFPDFTSGVTEDHNQRMATDSFFVSPRAPWDLHLRAGSPAIDMGSATGAPSIDLDRVPRPQGAAHDLGAYEYTTMVLPMDAGTDSGQDAGMQDAGMQDAGMRDANTVLDANPPPPYDGGSRFDAGPDAGGPPPYDAGGYDAPARFDGGGTRMTPLVGGCGCTVPEQGQTPASIPALLFGFGLVIWWRRR